ncbi:MAG: phosphonate transporter [Janthinobacterium lividum]
MTSIADTNPANLPGMNREELDALDFGLIKLDDTGIIQIYNRYESALASVPVTIAEGRNFFTQVAPCTNNRLVHGRFKEGVSTGEMDLSFSYTLTYKMRPTNVRMRLYRDAATETNWVLVQKQ